MGVERGGGGGWKKGGNLIQRRSKLPRHRRLITLKFDNERAIKMILMKNPVTQDQTRHFSPPPPPLLNSIKPHVTQKNMKKKDKRSDPTDRRDKSCRLGYASDPSVKDRVPGTAKTRLDFSNLSFLLVVVQ